MAVQYEHEYEIGNPPAVLGVVTYGAVSDQMLLRAPTDHYSVTTGVLRRTIHSFTDQMHVALEEGDPDVFCVTAKSAIPAADAVRGYYEELGRPTPSIVYIRADSRAAYSPHDRPKRIQDEVERLGNALSGMESAVVVEQLVSTGRTLDLASEILGIIGLSDIRRFSGSLWYYNALEEDISFADVTSVHSEFMNRVGHEAARNTPHSALAQHPKPPTEAEVSYMSLCRELRLG